METENDENVHEYWKFGKGNYIVKKKKDDDLDDECVNRNTLPAHLDGFIFSNSKRSLNIFFWRSKRCLRKFNLLYRYR